MTMQSIFVSDSRRWLVVACFLYIVFGVSCSADSQQVLLPTRVADGRQSVVVRERYLQNSYYNSNNYNSNGYNENGGNYNSNNYNNNGYSENGGSSTNTGSGYPSSSGSNSGGGTSSNYQFGSRIDNDEFFHWLEILGVIVGVALALTAVGFIIYCLLYPFILCCSCVQSEADAFHTIDTYDVATKRTLSSRPSDSYSMA